jgi:hypothetical protein
MRSLSFPFALLYDVCRICLFEYDTGYLLQRHSNDRYLAATKNIAFVVRAVNTVGNYDYNVCDPKLCIIPRVLTCNLV